VVAVAFDPASPRLFTVGGDGEIRVWPVRRGGLARRVDGVAGGEVSNLGFAADGALRVTLRDGTVRTVAADPPGPERWPGATPTVTFAANGDVALVRGRSPAMPLLGHFGAITASAVRADLEVATASTDGTVRLWTLPDDDALAAALSGLHVGCARAGDRQRYLGEDAPTAEAAAVACARER
jgi:WD40 repeat protein